MTALADASYDVRSVEAKPYKRSPYAPFRTTTLQQEASRKLGMGASVTMSVAQRLYENGFITYMRTDSTTLSGGAIEAARSQVRELYGAEYLPDTPRTYTSKVKNAQEAHEAIRPAGESFRTPAQTGLTGDQFRLYELIWMRTVASQMKDAVGQSVSVRIGGAASLRPAGEDVVFSASGRVITFHGFLKAYVEGTDEGAAKDDQETRLPALDRGRPGLGGVAQRQRPRDQAAVALHRGDPDQGARGPPDRPAVDVRLDHRHHPQPRLRLQEGHRAGAGVDRVLRGAAARGALHPAHRLRLHGADGDRPRRHRRRREGPGHRAPGVLLRLGAARRSQAPGRRPRRHRRQGARDLPDRRPRRRASTCGSASTAPTSRVRTTTGRPPPSGPTCPRTCRRTS